MPSTSHEIIYKPTTMRLTIVLFVLLFSGVSCTKSYCWQCVTNVITYTGSQQQGSVAQTTVCDKTEKEIKQAEQAGTYRTQATSGGVTVVVVAQTRCNRN